MAEKIYFQMCIDLSYLLVRIEIILIDFSAVDLWT